MIRFIISECIAQSSDHTYMHIKLIFNFDKMFREIINNESD